MKTIGIVAEFNPFHNGHAYLIEYAKSELGADYTVIAMSGDFVQRGEPACVDKYLRTQMALLGGADLVLELPSIFATASAEYFADSAVSLLAATGIVSTICFGTEHPDFPYNEVASLLASESAEYRSLLKESLSKGVSFPKAHAKAISSILSISEELLSEPNTILGIEYAKAALKHNVQIQPVLRQGNGYHSPSLSGDYLSASAIRNALSDNELLGISDASKELLKEYISTKNILSLDSISDLLYQELLRNQTNGYTDFFDCDLDLSNRIDKFLPQYQSCSQFIELIKTKRYTYTRINRVLLHIMLGITDEAIHNAQLYFRPLGFRKDASALLSELKAKGKLPLISKMADAKEHLSLEEYATLQKDIYAANLYEQLAHRDAPKRNELAQSPIRI